MASLGQVEGRLDWYVGKQAERRRELFDAINELGHSLVAALGNLWTSMRMVAPPIQQALPPIQVTISSPPLPKVRLFYRKPLYPSCDSHRT